MASSGLPKISSLTITVRIAVMARERLPQECIGTSKIVHNILCRAFLDDQLGRLARPSQHSQKCALNITHCHVISVIYILIQR